MAADPVSQQMAPTPSVLACAVDDARGAVPNHQSHADLPNNFERTRTRLIA
jgi:hypothetical protein